MIKRLPLKIIFLFLAMAASLTLGYWWIFIHPYVWIHSGRISASSFELKSSEQGTLTHLSLEPGVLLEKGSLLFTLENPRVLEKQQKNKTSLIDLQKELQFYKNQSDEAMQNYLSDLGVRSQSEIDQHLQKLQAAQLKVSQIQDKTQALLEEERRLEKQSSKTSTLSPSPAILLKAFKAAGDSVLPGDPILSLLDTSQCYIEAHAPEIHLHYLQLNHPVDIYLPAYPNQSWQGSISWIGPATLSTLQNTPAASKGELIPIKISITQENFPKKPGLSASIRIHK